MAEEREKYISSLYHIEKKLLNVKSKEDLGQISAEEIAKAFDADVIVRFFDSNEITIFNYIEGENLFGGDDDMSACQESFHSGSPCGNGTSLFSSAKGYYSPIFTQYGVLGVVGLSLKTSIMITDEQKTFLEMIIPQIAVVLQREKNYEKQQRTEIEMQRERLRVDMLRSISHDFRTPLAGVMGLASTLIDNYDKMNDEVKKNFLQSIYEDADWLNEIVENILQTTRFEEGRMQLNIAEEASEEIITEAVTHVKKHAAKHRIHVNIPDEIIWVRVDGVLIKQVLINILNNAISYSPANTDIYVSLYLEDDYAVFEVKDSGPGILPGELSHIFERYHRSGTNGTTNRKGMGLGLALCKSIIEAHNGKISVLNNNPHGTIVSFYLEAERSD
jgi:two-component system sensor histidine kinase KdpD